MKATYASYLPFYIILVSLYGSLAEQARSYNSYAEAYLQANYPNFYNTIRAAGGNAMLKDIVYLVVAVFLAAILLPPALQQIFTTNTSGWNPAVVPIFEILIPVVALIAVALYFFYELR